MARNRRRPFPGAIIEANEFPRFMPVLSARFSDVAHVARSVGAVRGAVSAGVLLAVLALWPSAADADDAVAILPHGGVTEAPVYELEDGDPPTVERASPQALLDDSIGASVVRDLKLLPDTGNLLSDVNGRGVVLSDADGVPRHVFDEGGEAGRVDAASVLAYASASQPAHVLIGDTEGARAAVVDPRDGETAWETSFALSGGVPEFKEVIALPGERAAIAASWPAMGLSAIDLFTVEAGRPRDRLRRLASAEGDASSDDIEPIVVEQLDGLRDVVGLADGNLLVTTRSRILELTQNGGVVWSVEIGDADRMHGEFAAAVPLDSDRVAVATFEPGRWVDMHTNHRVHWLSRADLEVERLEPIASTPALDFAPATIDRANGHGASGTVGYEPGLEPNEGDLGALELRDDLTLNADRLKQGDTLWARANLRYTGQEALRVRRAVIRAHPGACDEAFNDEDGRALVEENGLVFEEGQTYDLLGERAVDEEAFSAGRWCATVWAETNDGGRERLSGAAEFEIVEPSGEGSVDRRDLDYRRPGEEPGSQDSPSPFGDGCGCASTDASAPAEVLIFCALVGAWRLRRRYSS